MSDVFVDVDKLMDAILPLAKEELEANEFQPALLGFLDGAIRLNAFPQMNDDEWRDKMIWAAHVLCAGVQIDAIAWVSDSYGATSPTKKDGSPWQQGDLERAWQDDTPDKELITEMLLVNMFDRTGSGAIVTVPYIRQADGTIEPGERKTLIEGVNGGQLGGEVSDGLRSAILQDSIEVALRAQGMDFAQLGLSREAAVMHMACAATKTVLAQGVAVALGATSEIEMEVLEASFSGFRPESN